MQPHVERANGNSYEQGVSPKNQQTKLQEVHENGGRNRIEQQRGCLGKGETLLWAWKRYKEVDQSMIEIHAKSVTNGLIIMLGKVEMCRFLRCNGSIVRHYTSGIINVEEPVKSLKRWVSCRLDEDDPSPPKNLPNLTACGWEQIIDIDRALVHPQPELLDAVRGARTEETTTMKVEIPYHLQFGSHGFWFSVKKSSVWLNNTELV